MSERCWPGLVILLSATLAWADPPAAPAAPSTVSPEDLEVIRRLEMLRQLELLQRMHYFVEVPDSQTEEKKNPPTEPTPEPPE
jgi:hypothetical protein